MNVQALIDTGGTMVAEGKGLLAMDESTLTSIIEPGATVAHAVDSTDRDGK